MAAILESTYLIQLGGDAETLSLSRQQVLSCANKDDSPYWSAQCAGGDISEVRVWVWVCQCAGRSTPSPAGAYRTYIRAYSGSGV